MAFRLDHPLAPMVAGIAKTFHVQTKDEWEELFAVGLLAAHEASTRYEDGHGTTQQQYASKRVRGAMCDHRRKQFHTRHGNIGIAPVFVPLNDHVFSKLQDRNQEERIIQRSQVDWLLLCLTEKQRKVVIRYFWGDRKEKEIGLENGISESGVSLLIKRAIHRMRRKALGQC